MLDKEIEKARLNLEEKILRYKEKKASIEEECSKLRFYTTPSPKRTYTKKTPKLESPVN